MDIYDNIDTAIKIGLSGIIGAASTYFITKRVQRHEIKKDLNNEIKQMLKDCAFKIEKCSSTINDVKLSIYHVVVNSTDPSNELLQKEIAELTSGFNDVKDARALAYIIGERNLIESIDAFLNKFDEMVAHYGEKLANYDLEFIESKHDEIVIIKTKVLEKIGESFRSIYAK